MWGEQLRALEDTAWSFHKLANPMPQSQDAREHGCFRDIPLTPGAFLTHAHAASRVAMAQGRPRPVRFLDVGCGGGVKVLMAARYFEVCEGLEYDPAYAEAAGRMLETVGASTCSVMQADGLTFDGYAEYDVIYFFRPMQEAEPMQRLEARIAETARPGTILIAPYPSFAETAERTGCARIENAIYVVGLAEAEAHDLRHAAERVGIHTYDTRARYARNAGFMAPLVEAIWLTGFLE
jgi:trans-aconitate methyltransferase